MKFNRFLALLCALILMISSMTAAPPAFAEDEPAVEQPAEKPAEKPTPAPAPAPAAEPAEKPAPAPAPAAEKPAEKAAETPTAPAEEKPAEKPAETPTTPAEEKPADKPAEAPTTPAEEKPAETPAETPTTPAEEKPKETTTSADDTPAETPATNPDAEPSTEPEEGTTTEPAEVPPGEPAPLPEVKVSKLKPDKADILLGLEAHFTFHSENAESVEWSARRSDGLDGGSGICKDDQFTWKPEQSGIYTVEVTAVGGDLSTTTEKCQLTVRAGKLVVKAKPAVTWARVGDEELIYDLSITGGVEPYDVTIEIEYKKRKIYTSKDVVDKVVCDAFGFGDHKLKLKVTDAVGATGSDEAVIKASDDKPDEAPALPKLNADMTLAERVVAVARSQVGYKESEHNFIVRDDKSVQGWSYYGQWAGMPFEEWCAMFASYCLEMAGVPRWMLPQEANCNRWKNKLGKRYIDDEDEYIPEPGDLIFFHHDRVSKDPNFPNHVGIVVEYDPEKDLVYTVEGNSGAAVSNRIYNRTNAQIVGYASIGYCMKRWDKVYRQRMRDQLAEDRIKNALEACENAQRKLKVSDKMY